MSIIPMIADLEKELLTRWVNPENFIDKIVQV